MANKKQHGKFQQKPGTTHDPKTRRSLTGKVLDLDFERPAFSPVPGPWPTGVKRPFVVDVPEPMRVLTEVDGPVPGQPSRRERRPDLIKEAKQARRARRAWARVA